jgi:hypothetical protein
VFDESEVFEYFCLVVGGQRVDPQFYTHAAVDDDRGEEVISLSSEQKVLK